MINALRCRNCRAYFLGQSLSLIGTWTQSTTINWLCYTYTHSTLFLGLFLLAGQLPTCLLSPVGGVLSDRYPRLRALSVTQTMLLLHAATFSFIICYRCFTPSVFLLLQFTSGCINAFDIPIRQGLVPQLVSDTRQLSSAIALNTTLVNLARFIGPALAGILILHYGPTYCLMLNALSYLALLCSLQRISLPQILAAPRGHRFRTEFKHGLIYLRQTPVVTIPLVKMALANLFLMPYALVIPAFSSHVLHGDATAYGYLESAIGTGAAISGLFLAVQKSPSPYWTRHPFPLLLFSISLMLLAESTKPATAFISALLTGFAIMTYATNAKTRIQIHTPPQMQGRVMSYLNISYFGMMPLGSLFIGTLTDHLGPHHTLQLQGLTTTALASLYYFVSKHAPQKKP